MRKSTRRLRRFAPGGKLNLSRVPVEYMKFRKFVSVPIASGDDVAERGSMTARDYLAEKVRSEYREAAQRSSVHSRHRVYSESRFPGAPAKIDKTDPAKISEDEAIQNALDAFRDGVILLVADGRKVETLDEEIPNESLNCVSLLQLRSYRGP